MNNKIRIVIDIDDTICNNNNRDYKNAIPKLDVIDKINLLHDNGYEIVLHTARGMKSCNGNIDEIVKKNKEILIEWLKKNNVHYDELLFGKPLGDLYVDDKTMEVREFVNSKFEVLNGGSNLPVRRMGKYVIKELGSHDEVLSFQKWCNIATMCGMKFPHVVSFLYDRVYMDYVDGKMLSNEIFEDDIRKLFDKIYNLRLTHDKSVSFDISYHLDRIKENDIDENVHKYVKKSMIFVQELEKTLTMNSSFSHGDCILSNIIKKDDDYYFLDEHWKENSSSYLFDLAKIRMSLCGYDYIFNFSKTKLDMSLLNEFDKLANNIGMLDNLKKLQYMHILRCYRYKNKEDRHLLLDMMDELERNM